MKKVHLGRYFGGPLDGESAYAKGNRYSAYRNDDGTKMQTPKGDSLFMKLNLGRAVSSDRMQGYYQIAPRVSTDLVTQVQVFRHVYIHASVVWEAVHTDRTPIDILDSVEVEEFVYYPNGVPTVKYLRVPSIEEIDRELSQ